MRSVFVLLAATLALGCGARAPRPRVVLISVDGLWARDLQRAARAAGLKAAATIRGGRSCTPSF